MISFHDMPPGELNRPARRHRSIIINRYCNSQIIPHLPVTYSFNYVLLFTILNLLSIFSYAEPGL